VGSSVQAITGSCMLNFTTCVLPPFDVDDNTTVGELMADPRTAKAVEEVIARTTPLAGTEGSEAAQEAITAEMQRQMMVNAPLRTLRNFYGMTDAEVAAIVEEMRKLAK